jgi:multisubunit Na+/H+ antiporter MnhG subunit
MKKTTVRQKVLKMRFEDIYDRFQKGTLTTEEASELLGISVSVKRLNGSLKSLAFLMLSVLIMVSPSLHLMLCMALANSPYGGCV